MPAGSAATVDGCDIRIQLVGPARLVISATSGSIDACWRRSHGGRLRYPNSTGRPGVSRDFRYERLNLMPAGGAATVDGCDIRIQLAGPACLVISATSGSFDECWQRSHGGRLRYSNSTGRSDALIVAVNG